MNKFKTLLLLVLTITIALPAFSEDRVDSKIRFNDLYGEVSIRPDSEDDDAYEYAELDTIIYEDDRIRTKEDSGAILGLEDMSTYVIKPESTLIIHTEEGNVSKIEMLAGTMWGNIKKMSEGKSLEVEMNQCVCSINGTTFSAKTAGLTKLKTVKKIDIKTKPSDFKKFKKIQKQHEKQFKKQIRKGGSKNTIKASGLVRVVKKGKKKTGKDDKKPRSVNDNDNNDNDDNDGNDGNNDDDDYDDDYDYDDDDDDDDNPSDEELKEQEEINKEEEELKKQEEELKKQEEEFKKQEEEITYREAEKLKKLAALEKELKNNKKLSKKERRSIDEKIKKERDILPQQTQKEKQALQKKAQEVQQKKQALQEKQQNLQQRKQALQEKQAQKNNKPPTNIRAQLNNIPDTIKVTKGVVTIKNKITKEIAKVPAGYQATVGDKNIIITPNQDIEKDQNELIQELDRANEKNSTKQLIDNLNKQTGQINESKSSVDKMLDTIKKILESNTPSEKLKQVSDAFTKIVDEGRRFVSIFVEVNSTINVLSKRISDDSALIVSSEEKEAGDEAIKKANEAMNNFSQSLEALVGYADKIEEKLGVNPLSSLTSLAEKVKEIREAFTAINEELEEITKGISDESYYNDFKDAVTRCEAMLRDLQKLGEKIKAEKLGTDSVVESLKKQYMLVYIKIEKTIKDYSSVPEIKSATLSEMRKFNTSITNIETEIRNYLAEYNAILKSSTENKKRYVETVSRLLVSYDRMRRNYTKAERIEKQMEKDFAQSKYKTSEYNDVKNSWDEISDAMSDIDREASELSSCVEVLKSQLESLLGQ